MKSATKTAVAWLSAESAAAHLDMTPGAFRRMVYRERAKPQSRLRVHFLGGRMRFRQVDLDALVEALPEQAQQPAPLLVMRGGKR